MSGPGLDAPESCSMYCLHEGPGSCEEPCPSCWQFHDGSCPDSSEGDA